jgi:hypothetical protein
MSDSQRVVVFLSALRFLEDTGEIKGTAAFVYGCEVGCGAKGSMDFRAPPAAGIKIENKVIHQEQDSEIALISVES